MQVKFSLLLQVVIKKDICTPININQKHDCSEDTYIPGVILYKIQNNWVNHKCPNFAYTFRTTLTQMITDIANSTE